MFLNLLHSTRPTPCLTGGTLTVTARAEPEGSLLVEVSDTGKGISSADLEHVFRPFFHDARERQRPGSAAVAPDRHGARRRDLDRKRPDRGTSVFVRLPAAERRRFNMSAKILIVDDEELIRWSLSQDLANSGYKTVVAADLAEAEAALETENPGRRPVRSAFGARQRPRRAQARPARQSPTCPSSS